MDDSLSLPYIVQLELLQLPRTQPHLLFACWLARVDLRTCVWEL